MVRIVGELDHGDHDGGTMTGNGDSNIIGFNNCLWWLKGLKWRLTTKKARVEQG